MSFLPRVVIYVVTAVVLAEAATWGMAALRGAKYEDTLTPTLFTAAAASVVGVVVAIIAHIATRTLRRGRSGRLGSPPS